MMLPRIVHVFLLALLSRSVRGFENLSKRREFLLAESAKINLMRLDSELIDNLEKYAEKIEEKVSKLQRLAQELREPLEAAKGREEEYLGNPLHSFPLIRHLYQDWNYLEEFMKKPVGEENMQFLKRRLTELPWQVDTEDATTAVFRIAETYGMRPHEMAQGLIDNVSLEPSLSALDCFEIAKLYFKWGFFSEAHNWLVNAKTRMEEAYSEVHGVLGLTLKDVVLLQARCLVEWGYKEDANEVLLEHPDLAENSTSLLAQFSANPYSAEDLSPLMNSNYKTLCQSTPKCRYPPKPSRLSCRYNTTTSPYSILAPLKLEEISLRPFIAVYHDILSEKDIGQLTRLAESQLNTSNVLENEVDELRSHGRIALEIPVPHFEINPSGNPVINSLTQRIQDITGKKIRDRYPVKLIKHGFGTRMDLPYNFNTSNLDSTLQAGRIATLVLFLNDAPHGGSTVFPLINAKVPAEKGQALFYYTETKTLNAACPVFHGSKLALAAGIRV
ncbi:prolyl 4-hydroxylase subunit alpha-1 [Drosophila ficusphila]|uniref:prolyl 4-hydroxylase subunit alpha-1 n=1 Tax=Drosophila ficusphila TaxID=30025 RepID=UPI0007E81FBB|nr:prolyl 4-hydroxylase subunit alpha-1 [Drosophila ficusphila]